MIYAQGTSGVLLDRPDVTILDTRELEWESIGWFLPHAQRRILSRDEDGDPIIVSRWYPSDMPEFPIEMSYHLADEYYMCLAGELPLWESELGEPDELVIFREGYWMHRLPGCVHGHGIPSLPVGVKSIAWMMDGAPYVGVNESRGLTIEVPASGERVVNDLPPIAEPRAEPQPESAYRRHRTGPGGVAILKSREAEWEPHPYLPGTNIKVLDRAPDGDPTVTLLSLPAGRYPAPELPYRAANTFREFMYVLEGELTTWQYESTDDEEGTSVLLKESCYLDRRPGSVYGYAAEDYSLTGAVVLHFRTREGAPFIKDADRHKVWTRLIPERDPAPVTTPVTGSPVGDEEHRQEVLRTWANGA